MVRVMILFGLLAWAGAANATLKKWDGGGLDNQWDSPANWYPDGVPQAGDDILLDNSFLASDITVELPPGNISFTVQTLVIRPSGFTITCILPATNTASPALTLSGLPESLQIYDHGRFINASGAGAGTPLVTAGLIRLNNGGRYVHQTARANAGLIDKLATDAETAFGVFEFNVPGTAGYTVSLTGNTFGSLVFTAAAAGGSKSYSGSGSSLCVVRGDLIVQTGAQVTSTLTANILVGGSLLVDGRFSLNPVTVGASGRSLQFTGMNTILGGAGTIQSGAFFRNIEILKTAVLRLEKDFSLSFAGQSFLNQGVLDMQGHVISGSGQFIHDEGASLWIGDPSGISSGTDSGNIRTAVKSLHKKARYFYSGQVTQQTGTGLPDTVASLGFRNPSGVFLTRSTTVNDSIVLEKGIVQTDSTRLLILRGCVIRSPFTPYGETNTGWDSSYIDGPVIIELSDTLFSTCPLGQSGIFAPVKIRLSQPGSGKFFVRYQSSPYPDSTHSALVRAVSNREYWTLRYLSGNAMLQAAISYRPSSFPATWYGRVKPALYYIPPPPTGWILSAGREPGHSGNGWITMDTASRGFEAVSFGLPQPDIILPIRLSRLDAFSRGPSVILRWQADEDQQELKYFIEKSPDGDHFSILQEIWSANKTQAVYELEDKNPFMRETFYRITIESADRKELSRVIRVQTEGEKIRLFPNPARESIFIYFPGLRSGSHAEIVNVNGKVVKNLFVNTATCQIRVSDLESGYYWLMIHCNERTVTLPFIKD